MSPPTVLVVAQAQDGTADLVVNALLARGAEVATRPASGDGSPEETGLPIAEAIADELVRAA